MALSFRSGRLALDCRQLAGLALASVLGAGAGGIRSTATRPRLGEPSRKLLGASSPSSAQGGVLSTSSGVMAVRPRLLHAPATVAGAPPNHPDRGTETVGSGFPGGPARGQDQAGGVNGWLRGWLSPVSGDLGILRRLRRCFRRCACAALACGVRWRWNRRPAFRARAVEAATEGFATASASQTDPRHPAARPASSRSKPQRSRAGG